MQPSRIAGQAKEYTVKTQRNISRNRSTRMHRSHRGLEALEPRQMMSTTTLTGTGGDDTWLVPTLNSDDTLVLVGNGGHDTVKFGANGADAQAVKGTVLLKNAAGTFDIISNNVSGVLHDVKVGQGKIVGATGGTVDYSQSGLRTADLTLATGGSVKVTDTPANSIVRLNLSDIKWNVTVGNNHKIDGIKGNLKLNHTGATGLSTLTLDDASDTVGRTVTVFQYDVLGLAPANVRYIGFANTTLNTGTGDDVINIKGTVHPITLNGAGGKDNVTVGYFGQLNYITADISAGTPNGSVNIAIDDSAATTDQALVTTPGFVQLPVVPGTSTYPRIYANNASFSIKTGTGNDTIFVQDTPFQPLSIDTGPGNDHVQASKASAYLTIYTRGGNDTVDLGQPLSGSISKLRGGFINTGNGYDVITIHDEAEIVGHNYKFSNTGFYRNGADGFFAIAEVFGVHAGSADDSINGGNITSSNIAMYAWGGKGQDEITGGRGNDSLFGEDGFDTLYGGKGVDQIYGGDKADMIYGGDGTDYERLDGGAGDDTVRGDIRDNFFSAEHVTITGGIQGTVYNDLNGNGMQDAGEPGLANFWVWVDSNDNGKIDSQDMIEQADASGHFEVDNLEYGQWASVSSYGAQSWHQTSNGGKARQFYLPWNTLLGGQDIGLKSN
jgi:Ca2+-binding RTX toxin-like protein